MNNICVAVFEQIPNLCTWRSLAVLSIGIWEYVLLQESSHSLGNCAMQIVENNSVGGMSRNLSWQVLVLYTLLCFVSTCVESIQHVVASQMTFWFHRRLPFLWNYAFDVDHGKGLKSLIWAQRVVMKSVSHHRPLQTSAKSSSRAVGIVTHLVRTPWGFPKNDTSPRKSTDFFVAAFECHCSPSETENFLNLGLIIMSTKGTISNKFSNSIMPFENTFCWVSVLQQ